MRAEVDLESAVSKQRIETVEEDADIARKKETTDIDVTQSEADVSRTLAEGVSSGISGFGNSEFYQSLVLFLSIIFLLIIIAVVWYVLNKQKKKKLLENQNEKLENDKS
ncbi:MAG: hypothetical protein FJ190_10130 [Gammaproteobacteria bacterium]|nr:hypothetical protein [Gammaproteobacteria bacterium]